MFAQGFPWQLSACSEPERSALGREMLLLSAPCFLLTLPSPPGRQRSLRPAESRNPAHQPEHLQRAADGPADAAHDVRGDPVRRRGRLPGKAAPRGRCWQQADSPFPTPRCTSTWDVLSCGRRTDGNGREQPLASAHDLDSKPSHQAGKCCDHAQENLSRPGHLLSSLLWNFD